MIAHSDDELSVGSVIVAEDLPAYVLQVEPPACRERALALLGRAEQSRDSLASKLRARGYAAQTVRVVLDELEHDGIVDDARFSEVWLNARVRRAAEGPRALVAGLVRRGVSPDVAESAVESFIADNPEVRTWALRRATDKILRSRSMTQEELSARLLRKGFTHADIRDIF